MEETKKEELSGLRDAFISTSSIREIFLQKILE